MQISLFKGSSLPADILAAWTRLQRSNPSLASPYFSPAYTQTVAAARDDVEVAVMGNAGRVEAIFPFERRAKNMAGPVGSFISDYHGLISEPNFSFAPKQLLRSCNLVAWNFNYLPVNQISFSQYFLEQYRSPIIDLSSGYEAYVKERREAGTEQIKKNGNLFRRLEREVGPVRFVAHSPEPAQLSQLIAWKTDQFRHNGWQDIFSLPWVRNTVEAIHAIQTPEFAGMLSLLYAGDKLVAAHFGMRSATVWHYWFPSYAPAFSKYSPGVMLLLKMAEDSAALGISTIDLGCGEHSYKERLMNGFVTTAKGSVERPALITLPRILRRNSLNFIRRHHGLHQLARQTKKFFKSNPTAS